MIKKSKIKDILKISFSFLKVGTIGFGGGSALIPVIEKEVVQDKKYIGDDTFIEHTIAANITPGALPVKLGASTGKVVAGGLGSILGGVLTALPGVTFTIMLISLISILGESFIHYVEYGSVGISTFIVLLLMLYIIKVMDLSKKTGILYESILIMILSFFVTSGKEIRQIYSIFIGIDYKSLSNPIYDITTLNLMIVSFFIIIFTSKKFSKIKLLYCSLVSYVFIDISGKNGFIPHIPYLNQILYGVMIISILFSIFYDSKKGTKEDSKTKPFDFSVFKAILGFIILSSALILITYIIYPKLRQDGFDNIPGNQNLMQYVINVIISSFTSFGGGEAYISVADGFFVQNGFIQANTFYSQVVAIANALPGPILVKVAAGIGYSFGFAVTGSLLGGVMVGFCGLLLSVSASCIAMLLVVAGYDSLKNSPILKSMKLYILPVVCGMLITTSISMIYEVLKITNIANIGSIYSIIYIIGNFLIMLLLHKKYHVQDVLLIIGSAIFSVIFCMIF